MIIKKINDFKVNKRITVKSFLNKIMIKQKIIKIIIFKKG